jgi:hypothetical protein
MAGARACGMRHIWLVREGAEQRVPCCREDRVVHSLGEIEPLV